MAQRRGPWSTTEDAYLIQLVESQGASNWVRISSLIGTRTPKQCRERYHQNLKKSLNHEPITEEEGILIEQLVHTIGKRWAEIARRLQGRSDNAVKNWWNGSQNRRKRHDRRKANHQGSYDEPAAMSPYPRAHLQGPLSTVPLQATRPPPSMSQQRPLPPPLLASSMHDSNRYFPYDTPLSSPSLYSPDSEVAPSLMSDTGSHYSTSPRAYDRRSPPDYDLPPIKIASDGGQSRYSPRASMSLPEKLPSLSAMVPIPPAGSPEYPRPPALPNRLPPMAPPPPPPPHHQYQQQHYHHPHHQQQGHAQAGDYFSHREPGYLPTAPSSPESPYGETHLRPNLPHRPHPDHTQPPPEYHRYQRPENQRPPPPAHTTPEYGARRLDSQQAPPPAPPADKKSEKRVMGVDSLLGP
ncbi:hypothetical protein B0T19DRAFT_400502 [Cercophora scortea]|uniref:Uncharacterized protein n=1 Tax=Cercophora scortea TaxID=314031 RepID=A0AAE0MCR9_9PEZI|nr:hypothetical protein B0T19DRAFT_400502 [Cercophora scortea]